MRFFSLLMCLCVAGLGAGCTSSRVVEEKQTWSVSTAQTASKKDAAATAVIADAHAPEVVIDKFGDVSFNGKRVAPEEVGKAVASAGIPKTRKIRISIPENLDPTVMGKVAGQLHLAGYGTVFVKDKKASINVTQ